MKSLKFLTLLSAGLTLVGGGAFAAPTEEAAAPDAPLEIIWQGVAGPMSFGPEDGNPLELLIEERFDVSITPLAFPSIEARDLYYSSGNTADKITIFPRETLYKFIDQGIIREFPEEWMWEYMPAWMERMVFLFGRDLVVDQAHYKGKVYGVPYGNYGDFLPSFPVVRKDWMDNLGVAEAPQTLDEFRELAIRFTRDDPDGNGQNDTYGVHSRSDRDRARFTYIFAAHGVNYFGYELVDGKVTFPPQTDNWKEALRFVRDLYASGAVDPESLTDKRDQQRKKWAAGMFGILLDNAWWMVSSTKGNVLDLVRAQNPQAEFAYIGHLQGPDHGRGPLTSQPFGLYTEGSAHFGAKTSDEKVKRIMQIQDAFSSDLDFWLRGQYGEEGVHWDWQDGVLTLRDVSREELEQQGVGVFYSWIPALLDEAYLTLDKPSQEIYAHAFSLNTDPNEAVGVKLSYPSTNQHAIERGVDVLTIKSEFYFDVVLGKVDLDAEWPNFQQRLKDAGVEEIKAEYERMHAGG